MNRQMKPLNWLASLLLAALFLIPFSGNAQCPSVVGSGSPAVAFMTIYGATYLLSLILAWVIVIKLRQTIEWREPTAKQTLQIQD